VNLRKDHYRSSPHVPSSWASPDVNKNTDVLGCNRGEEVSVEDWGARAGTASPVHSGSKRVFNNLRPLFRFPASRTTNKMLVCGIGVATSPLSMEGGES